MKRRHLIPAVVMTAVAIAVALLVAPTLAQQYKLSVPGAADYYDILELNARYAHGLDSGTDGGQMFARTFTDDGQFVDADGHVTQGRDALAAMARSTPSAGVTNVSHFVVNVSANLTPGGATQLSYVLIVAARPNGEAEFVTDGGQYWDELARTNEGWRIRKRTFLRSGVRRPEASAFFGALAGTAGEISKTARDAKNGGGLTSLDRAEIFQLYSHYVFAVDKAFEDGQALANLFAPDGIMIDASGTTTVGHDKIAELAWKKGPINYQRTYFTNLMLDPTPNGAIATAYVMTAQAPPQPTLATISSAGMFVDVLVKTPAGWRFKRKALVKPHATVPADTEAAVKAAKSEPARAVQAGHSSTGNQFTADDYAAIQQLYARYAHGFDSKVDDGAMYLSVFSRTATFTDQWDRTAVGIEGLDKTYAHSQSGSPNPIGVGHSTWNVLIDPAPWGAVGRSYTGGGRINMPGAPPGTGLVGEYVDMIVKTPEGWRFERRSFRQEFIRTAPGAPRVVQATPATGRQ